MPEKLLDTVFYFGGVPFRISKTLTIRENEKPYKLFCLMDFAGGASLWLPITTAESMENLYFTAERYAKEKGL